MKIRNVSVLILQDKDKILLQKRPADAKRYPGKWGLFGGGIEEEEDPLTAVKREIMEELGVSLCSCSLLNKCSYVSNSRDEAGEIFVFKSQYHGEKISLNEGGEMAWLTIKEALDCDLTSDFRNILETIGQNDKSVVS